MKILFFLITLTGGLLLAGTSQAICPVCTVAVGAGLGLSRWLGIDDTISGIWIGGILISVTTWTIEWLKKKNFNSRIADILIAIGFYALTLVPLYFMGIFFHPGNQFWGLDKLILGIIAGSVLFYSGVILHFYLKRRNGGQSYFPFQKVACPLLPLLAASAVFYFITKQ